MGGGRCWLVITYQETAVLTLRGTVQPGAPPVRRVSKQFEALCFPPPPSRTSGAAEGEHGDLDHQCDYVTEVLNQSILGCVLHIGAFCVKMHC